MRQRRIPALVRTSSMAKCITRTRSRALAKHADVWWIPTMATAQQFVFPDRVRFLSGQPKPSDLSLAPYARVNGQWTLPDEVVLAVAQQSIRDGTFRTVFIEGDVQSPEEFVMMCQNQR